MLSKLLKKDFTATSRFFLPLLGGYAIAAMVAKLLFEMVLCSTDIFSYDNPISSGLTIFSFIYFTMCVFYLIACYLMTTVFVVYDFYKTMVSSHGYLTHTLPVTTGMLLWSKILMAVIWSLAVNLLIGLSLLLLFTGHFPEIGLFQTMRDLFRFMDVNFGAYSFYMIFNMVLGLFQNPLMFFACISIGQLWREHRIMGAILTYIGIHTGTQIFSTVMMIVTGNSLFSSPYSVSYSGYLLAASIFGVFMTVMYFVVTWYILSKKLNLE